MTDAKERRLRLTRSLPLAAALVAAAAVMISLVPASAFAAIPKTGRTSPVPTSP